MRGGSGARKQSCLADVNSLALRGHLHRRSEFGQSEALLACFNVTLSQGPSDSAGSGSKCQIPK